MVGIPLRMLMFLRSDASSFCIKVYSEPSSDGSSSVEWLRLFSRVYNLRDHVQVLVPFVGFAFGSLPSLLISVDC